MFRTSLVALLVSLLLTTAAMAQNKKESAPKQEKKVIPTVLKTETAVAWFDLEHCPICKCMSSQKGLMESMKWETHVIDNGMLSVAVIPPDKKEAMATCKKNMMAVIEKVKAGEKMELCGYCNSYGALELAGAKKTEIETAAGVISMLTSDNPEVVKKIQDHAKTTIKEYEAMVAAQTKSAK